MSRHDTPTGKRVIYYHTNWSCYARNFQVKDIPNDVTDIAYAFWDVNADGSICSRDVWADTDKRYTNAADSIPPPDDWNNPVGLFGNFGQFKKLLDSGRKLNVTLSLGGWSWSKHFSDAVSTENTRTRFVTNIVETLNKYPIFNGVSLDWEFVSNDGVNYGHTGNTVSRSDSKNFVLFLKQLRNTFNQDNRIKHYTIAMCCVAAPEKAKFDVEQMHPYLDELHVMTYDFHDGNWGETKTAHHTNPRKSSHGKWSCEEAADYYLSRGVPAHKIFIGAAFYSRGFANTNGLGQPASGGSPDMSWEKGVVDYKALPMPGAQEFLDPESKAAYSYDPVKRVFNSYDNRESILEKCRIVYEKNLGGVLVWENSADKPVHDPRSLVATLRDHLTHGRPSGTVPPAQPLTQPLTQPPAQPLTQPPAQPLTQPSVQVQANCKCSNCFKYKTLKVSFDINLENGSVENIKTTMI
jgi:chitinase